MKAPKKYEFDAIVRVTHRETWSVEAATADEAREKFKALSDDVVTEDGGGEVVDWEVGTIKQAAS